MIDLIKSTFYHEAETKKLLTDFITDASHLSMGKQCREFEIAFAKKQERKYAVFVNSGSMANLVLIQALINLGRLSKDQRVGVSALTWATNVMPLIQLGLKPVLLDCEIETLNVSPKILENATNKIDALFITNVLGLSDDLPRIKEICEEHNILLFEDNCESLGSKIGGTLLGNFGVAGTFSFFVGHHLSTIEGGMIVTDDEELHDMLVMVRAHGWDRNLSPEKQLELRKKNNVDSFYAKYLFYELAYNARPTEINGFVGNTQIGFWDEIVSKRQENYRQFTVAVKENSDLIPVQQPKMEILSSFALPIVSKTKEVDEKLKERFSAHAETRPIIAGDISQQPFFKKYRNVDDHCPNAEFLHQNGFYIANNPELTAEEIDLIISLLKA